MLSVVLVGHVIAGVLYLGAHYLGAGQRKRFLPLGAGAGVVLAGLLFFTRGSSASWSSLVLDPGPAALSAAAILCSWAIYLASDEPRRRWDVGALVGAGCAGLLGFATTEWVAPAMLFWLVTSAAVVVGANRHAGRPLWLLVGLSDVCVIGGLGAYAIVEETWRLPDEVRALTFLLPLVAGVLLRTMALPRLWGWNLSGQAEAALLPILVGSGFALIPRVSGGDDIWVALPMLVLAVGCAGWCILRPSLALSLLGPWITALMMAVVWIEPRALGKASTAALLGVGALALWPLTAGRSVSERGLILAAVPATVGFGALLGGAQASFGRAAALETVVDSIPWSAFAALLPVALAAGVTVGAAIGRRLERPTYRPVAVLTTWGLALLALLLGLSPTVQLGFAGGSTVWLSLVAVAAGVAAARFFPKPTSNPRTWTDREPMAGTVALPAPAVRPLSIAGVGLSGLTILGAAIFTYIGLRNGFL